MSFALLPPHSTMYNHVQEDNARLEKEKTSLETQVAAQASHIITQSEQIKRLQERIGFLKRTSDAKETEHKRDVLALMAVNSAMAIHMSPVEDPLFDMLAAVEASADAALAAIRAEYDDDVVVASETHCKRKRESEQAVFDVKRVKRV